MTRLRRLFQWWFAPNVRRMLLVWYVVVLYYLGHGLFVCALVHHQPIRVFWFVLHRMDAIVYLAVELNILLYLIVILFHPVRAMYWVGVAYESFQLFESLLSLRVISLWNWGYHQATAQTIHWPAWMQRLDPLGDLTHPPHPSIFIFVVMYIFIQHVIPLLLWYDLCNK